MKLLESGVDGFFEEAKSVRVLKLSSSKSIRKKKSTQQIQDQHFVIMEYVEGGMLFDMCKMMGAMGENIGRFFAC